MRLTPIGVLLVLATVVALRLGVMPLLGLELAFQRTTEVFAGLGVLTAALAFDRGDPPLRPWAILAVGLFGIPLARIASHFAIAGEYGWLRHVNLGLIILSNALCVVALLWFRQILISTGLTPEWTASARLRAVILGALLTAACLGLISYHMSELGDLRAMGAEDLLGAIVLLVSIVVDGIIFAFGLLLVRLVMPMMGGGVALPYILVASGGAIFLFIDLFSVIFKVTTQDQFTTPLPMAIACVGWTAFGLAGISQRQLVQA